MVLKNFVLRGDGSWISLASLSENHHIYSFDCGTEGSQRRSLKSSFHLVTWSDEFMHCLTSNISFPIMGREDLVDLPLTLSKVPCHVFPLTRESGFFIFYTFDPICTKAIALFLGSV